MEPSALEDFPALYNITPGVNTWIARSGHGQPTLQPYLWGLVPHRVEGARVPTCRCSIGTPDACHLWRERRLVVVVFPCGWWEREPGV